MSSSTPFCGEIQIADTSVWRRSHRLPGETSQQWQEAVAAGEIATSPPVVLELLYKAAEANVAEFRKWRSWLEQLDWVRPDRAVWRLAYDAYTEMGESSQLLGKSLTDILVAATATRIGIPVLHYDKHYDQLAALSCLDFESRWVANPGSLP